MPVGIYQSRDDHLTTNIQRLVGFKRVGLWRHCPNPNDPGILNRYGSILKHIAVCIHGDDGAANQEKIDMIGLNHSLLLP